MMSWLWCSVTGIRFGRIFFLFGGAFFLRATGNINMQTNQFAGQFGILTVATYSQRKLVSRGGNRRYLSIGIDFNR